MNILANLEIRLQNNDAEIEKLEAKKKIAPGSLAAFNAYVNGLRTSETDYWIPEDHGTFYE